MIPMSYKKLAKIVEELSAATDREILFWEETIKDDTFQTALSGYAVRISRVWFPDEDCYEYSIKIYNEAGRLVEEADQFVLVEDLENATTVMYDLFEKARRVAMGTDTALDSIISELSKEWPSSN